MVGCTRWLHVADRAPTRRTSRKVPLARSSLRSLESSRRSADRPPSAGRPFVIGPLEFISSNRSPFLFFFFFVLIRAYLGLRATFPQRRAANPVDDKSETSFPRVPFARTCSSPRLICTLRTQREKGLFGHLHVELDVDFNRSLTLFSFPDS